jgi:hypothetical protein
VRLLSLKQSGYPLDRAGKADTECRAGNPDDTDTLAVWNAMGMADSAVSGRSPDLLYVRCGNLAVIDLLPLRVLAGGSCRDVSTIMPPSRLPVTLLIGPTTSSAVDRGFPPCDRPVLSAWRIATR